MNAVSAIISGRFSTGVSVALVLSGILAYAGLYVMCPGTLRDTDAETEKEKAGRKIAGIICALATIPLLFAPVF